MANSAPGVNINVTASASSPTANAATGTWFVLGVAAGPAGVAVPVNSMSDFNTYFGQIVNGQVTGRYTLNSHVDSTLLYDALDVFFREGGVRAYVSRIEPQSTGVAATSGTTGGKFVLTAFGKGTWANSSNSGANGVILTLSGATVNSNTVYTAAISYNGTTLARTGGLTSDVDVVNWINSLSNYVSMCYASTVSGSSILPASGSSVSIYLTGGTDASVADADVPAALSVFSDAFGPGQISYPGATSVSTYVNLADHAQANNRVAVLDAQNTGVAADLLSDAATIQGTAIDPSYASIFAPWLIVPGVVNTNPNQPAGAVINRTVAPSALAAAKMAANDSVTDANNPAAGITNGKSNYSVNISAAFSAADRASLNSAGINVIRNVPGANIIAVYGYRSLAFDANWQFLNNVRFRMQVTRDFNFIAESFVFAEIDGKGHLFATLNGALAGQCQSYWTRKSIYGATPSEAFSVNTGPQINTPATIAVGQVNAAVNLRMSPFGEFVTVNVTKYLVTAPLPNYNA